jgi:L-histidine Nalpha-methyltransferase
MDWTTNVAVHESASPDFTRERILAALQRGELDPSLLYAGLRQTSLWTHLHDTLSPARTDSSVAGLYETAFGEIARNVCANVVHVVSLACGSGGKDVSCLRALRTDARATIYTPADISVEMVLTAQRIASRAFRGLQCTPLVCDLARCSVLPAILKQFDPSGTERLILFLGTIHNYWPSDILKSVLYPLRAQDQLLVGANLAPSENYNEHLTRILAQYDNPPTRAWLMGALSELGLMKEDGELYFRLADAEDKTKLGRIEARFRFSRVCEARVLTETVRFDKGSELRAFYSYRFTPDRLRAFLQDSGLEITSEWLSLEEGLFLCRRSKGLA